MRLLFGLVLLLGGIGGLMAARPRNYKPRAFVGTNLEAPHKMNRDDRSERPRFPTTQTLRPLHHEGSRKKRSRPTQAVHMNLPASE